MLYLRNAEAAQGKAIDDRVMTILLCRFRLAAFQCMVWKIIR